MLFMFFFFYALFQFCSWSSASFSTQQGGVLTEWRSFVLPSQVRNQEPSWSTSVHLAGPFMPAWAEQSWRSCVHFCQLKRRSQHPVTRCRMRSSTARNSFVSFDDKLMRWLTAAGLQGNVVGQGQNWWPLQKCRKKKKAVSTWEFDWHII